MSEPAIPVESVSVKQFSQRLVSHLLEERRNAVSPAEQRFDRDWVREGHSITMRRTIGGVCFFVLWHGERRWAVKGDAWFLHSRMNNDRPYQTLSVSGNQQAFVSDMTMLMMAAEIDDE
jgi:hypothetical protein